MMFPKKHILSLLIVFLTFNTAKTAHSGWVADPEGGSADGQVCTVTTNLDSIDEQQSLRRKLKGYNSYGKDKSTFCSQKIILKSDVHLNSAITINNPEDSDGIIIEGQGNSKLINVVNIQQGCAITLKSDRVTLKNITLRNGDNPLCIESDYNILENVTIQDANGTAFTVSGSYNKFDKIVSDKNGSGMHISGTNNSVTNSVFKNNDTNGVVLTKDTGNVISKNSYYNNGGDALSSPATDIAPTIDSGTKISSTQFSVQVSFDTDVEKVELYRTFPKTGDTTFIAETSSFTSRTATFTIDATTGDSVFALGFFQNRTSDMSNVQPLSEFNTGGQGGSINNCSEGPIEPGTVINPNGAKDVGYPALQDSDCDGILDNDEDKNKNLIWEPALGETDVRNSDSDGDGLHDGQEDLNRDGVFQQGTETNPLDEDTDGDGILDGVEDFNQNGIKNSTESDPKKTDTDEDGIPDNLEDKNLNGKYDVGLETKTYHGDTDLDGLGDGVEDANHNGQVDPGESDPRVVDTDSDTLPDGSDLCPTDPDTTCTQPCIPGQVKPEGLDTDYDGLFDREEDFNKNCQVDPPETDWKKSDTDGDGINDRLDPCPKNNDITCKSACVPGGQVPENYDPDGDGIPQKQEDKNGNCIKDAGESDGYDSDTDDDGLSDAVDPDPNKADSDNDGLLDGQEDLNKDGVVNPGETDPNNPDTDGDGLNDAFDPCPTSNNPECTIECVPGVVPPETKDSDGDGVPNKYEDADHDCVKDPTEMNAFSKDTDGDGLEDGIEDQNSNGVVDEGETSPLKSDTDGDGQADGIEDFNKNGQIDPGETDPTKADTDGDGLNDGQDPCPTDPNPECSFQCVPGVVPSNAFLDSDGDGLINSKEDINLNCVVDFGETDPSNSDSDNDGLPDGLEDKNKNGQIDPGETNPKNPDSDGDGIIDGLEDKNKDGFVGQNECDPSKADTDGDGIADQFEDKNQNGICDEGETCCYLTDSDLDGLSDGQEDVNKNGICDAGETCANNPDTDGDGANDGQESQNGTNPLKASKNDLDKATGESGCSLVKGSTPGTFVPLAWILTALFGLWFLVRRMPVKK